MDSKKPILPIARGVLEEGNVKNPYDVLSDHEEQVDILEIQRSQLRKVTQAILSSTKVENLDRIPLLSNKGSTELPPVPVESLDGASEPSTGPDAATGTPEGRKGRRTPSRPRRTPKTT